MRAIRMKRMRMMRKMTMLRFIVAIGKAGESTWGCGVEVARLTSLVCEVVLEMC